MIFRTAIWQKIPIFQLFLRKSVIFWWNSCQILTVCFWTDTPPQKKKIFKSHHIMQWFDKILSKFHENPDFHTASLTEINRICNFFLREKCFSCEKVCFKTCQITFCRHFTLCHTMSNDKTIFSFVYNFNWNKRIFHWFYRNFSRLDLFSIKKLFSC